MSTNNQVIQIKIVLFTKPFFILWKLIFKVAFIILVYFLKDDCLLAYIPAGILT